jgi:hypothetical protein
MVQIQMTLAQEVDPLVLKDLVVASNTTLIIDTWLLDQPSLQELQKS